MGIDIDHPKSMFNRAHQAMDETVQAKAVRINPARTAPKMASKGPAQSDPDVDQDRGQAQAEEAQGRVHRIGADAYLSSLAIRALNAEAPPITRFAAMRRPIQLDQHKYQPFPATTPIPSARQRRHHRYLGHSPVSEGVGRMVAVASSTQGACAAGFATNGTGQNRGLMMGLQVLKNISTTEPLVQKQRHLAEAQHRQALQQALHNLERAVFRPDIRHRQSQPHIAPHQVRRGKAKNRVVPCFA